MLIYTRMVLAEMASTGLVGLHEAIDYKIDRTRAAYTRHPHMICQQDYTRQFPKMSNRETKLNGREERNIQVHIDVANLSIRCMH